jgi:hypothetical protein
MYLVFIYESRRMKPIEIVLRSGEGEKRENGREGKSNKHILQAHV